MSIIDALCDVYEVVVAFIVQALRITVTLHFSAEHGESPSLLAHAGRHGEEGLAHAVGTNLVTCSATTLSLKAIGDDVDGTTYRWCRNL